MTRRMKLMTGLSTLAAVSALALTGCGGEGEGEGAEGEVDLSTTISGEAEGEGAGAEGESEGATASGDPATDDVAYLKLLGLVRGHLIAFYELYQSGSQDMARMHVKHPESELYMDIAPAFGPRGQTGFADELTALVSAAAAGGEVDSEYSDAVEALNAHMPAAGPAVMLLAVSEIIRVAADEFDIGVEDDGAISNAHEYQDAYGFLVASRDMVAGIETTDVNATDAISLAHEQIELALASFDGLTADMTEGRPSTLYGAAARIELAARGLM
ncbi:hypothetical protein ACFOOP_14640 [Marinicaulis aureus]|uniref:DUF2202 domain-containing protein n=1 Tax=Hyphococcus aureus TaxID=2666033 RepID=A0ABW1L363_9PROT